MIQTLHLKAASLFSTIQNQFFIASGSRVL